MSQAHRANVSPRSCLTEGPAAAKAPRQAPRTRPLICPPGETTCHLSVLPAGQRTRVRFSSGAQRSPSQAFARARRKARSRWLRVSLAAASNSGRASARRPARKRKSPRAAGSGA